MKLRGNTVRPARLAVIRNEETYEFRLCSVFDHGLSLCSDIGDYPLESDVHDCIRRVAEKPFDRSFDEQVDAVEELYGLNLCLCFTKKDVTECLASLETFYSTAILHRVETILFEQIRRYPIYFRRQKLLQCYQLIQFPRECVVSAKYLVSYEIPKAVHDVIESQR